MEVKLYTVIQLQNIFQNNQTRLKYWFPWQQTTLNSGIYEKLIVIDLGHFTAETLRISHINHNALYRPKICPAHISN